VFRHCTFKQVVRASGIGSANVFATFTRPVVFEDCRFYGACNFRNAVLLDKLSFVKCLFDSALNLQSTDCAGAVNLDNTACSGAVQAQDATFRKKVSAINATFLTSVSFQGSTFFGPANFSNSTFEQYVDFGLARFMGHVFYNYVSFRSNAVFNQCRFMGRAEWLTVNSNNMQVQQALFSEPPRFTNSKFTGRLDLSESKYLSGKPDLTGITGTVTGN